MDHNNARQDNAHWIDMAYNRDWLRAHVNMVMNLLIL
jgi:hypothetical protein